MGRRWVFFGAPERFRAKWIPVRVKKTRQNKRMEPSDSIRAQRALGGLAANTPNEPTAVSDSVNGVYGLAVANQILIQKWRGCVELKIWSRNRNNPKPNRDTHAEMKSTSFAMFAMSMLSSPKAFRQLGYGAGINAALSRRQMDAGIRYAMHGTSRIRGRLRNHRRFLFQGDQ